MMMKNRPNPQIFAISVVAWHSAGMFDNILAPRWYIVEYLIKAGVTFGRRIHGSLNSNVLSIFAMTLHFERWEIDG
jgi:hypothetical protein